MCVLRIDDQKCQMINRSKLGRAVRGVLTQAKMERRLICGLLPAIAHLEKDSEDVVLCVLPQTRPGDAATHMQTVLLQAFCYENCIPVIQVDSGDKLGDYCGLTGDCPCALITMTMEHQLVKNNNSPKYCDQEQSLSPSEQVLMDFYECTLEEFPRPIIELPI